jgi:hypothetical protein
MPADTLLERPAHPREGPDVARQFAVRVRTLVVVLQLPVRFDAQRRVALVEREPLRILDEVEEVRVAAVEFRRAVFCAPAPEGVPSNKDKAGG